jgi:hypothetical protein
MSWPRSRRARGSRSMLRHASDGQIEALEWNRQGRSMVEGVDGLLRFNCHPKPFSHPKLSYGPINPHWLLAAVKRGKQASRWESSYDPHMTAWRGWSDNFASVKLFGGNPEWGEPFSVHHHYGGICISNPQPK